MAAFDFSLGAGGMADALQDVIQAEHGRKIQTSQAELAKQALLRQLAGDEESRRRWEADHAVRLKSAESLEAQRKAAADAAAAQAKERADRAAGLERLATDPNAFAGMTPAQRLFQAARHGVANIGVHDLESPDEHNAHTKGEKEAAFADWQRRTDYTEQQRRERPVRLAGARVVQDDPALPLGTQRYLVEIARKHGGDFASAQAELAAYLADPQTQQDHPRLSPVKAIDALRRQFTGAGGARALSPAQQAVADAMRDVNLGGGPASAPARAGGAAPGADAVPSQVREQARSILRGALGRDVTDADIQKFLSSPQNRAKFGIQ